MSERKYQGETWTGRKYWEDEDGNREYEGETWTGRKFRENEDGERTYEGETWTGRKYREDPEGNREYKDETWTGNVYWEDNDGNRTYEGETWTGRKYEENNAGFKKTASGSTVSDNGNQRETDDYCGYSGSSSVPGSSCSDSSPASGLGLVVGVLVCAAIVYGIWFASNTIQTNNAIAHPPSVVIVTGACPFEGCQLGRWIARKSIPVYEHPGGGLKQKLRQGEVIYATSAEVRAVPKKAIVTRTYKSDEKEGLNVGSLIYVLYPIGEGAVAVWNKGNIVNGSLDLAFQYDESVESRQLQWEWWVQIRLANGTTGWLHNPQGQLKGMDRFG
jgi:hypothetical protein